MRRSGRLERYVPLRSGKRPTGRSIVPPPGLNLQQAAAALTHAATVADLPRDYAGPVEPPARSERPAEVAAFAAVVRQTILDRDDYCCQRCGVPIDDGVFGYSLQHRVARGMGGSSNAALGRPANGLVLCGSGSTGCHGWVEEHPTEAAAAGWAVKDWADPASVPVLTMRHGWMRLNDRGLSSPCPTPAGDDAHSDAIRRSR